MRLLLTSAGVTNPSIHTALVDLLGKPIDESTALCIPTSQWGHPMCGPETVRRFVAGQSPLPMVALGWKSVGMLELTALPSIGTERWVPWVREADALLVAGGDASFLAHWIEESGLADVVPSLDDTVWVGLSGGSMALTPRVGSEFVEWTGRGGDDRGIGVVDFAIFPHLGLEPENLMADAEAWAATIGCPAYAIDDDTAIRVRDGAVDVVSEGEWRHFSA